MKLKSLFTLALCVLSLPAFSMKTITLNDPEKKDQERMTLAQSFAEKEQWVEVFKLMYEMALEGNVTAQSNLAMLYNLGRGTAQDKEKAYWWYSEAAEKGYIKALNNLGVMYLQGDYVKQDREQAIKIFERTANAKDTRAMLVLSSLYRTKDPKKAQEWLKKAAELGNEEAKRELEKH